MATLKFIEPQLTWDLEIQFKNYKLPYINDKMKSSFDGIFLISQWPLIVVL